MALQIEQVDLATLTENPDNAVIHSEENLAAIRRSLEAFGQAEPLVVQKSSRKVIGGNGRLSVMRAMGWTEADAVLLDIDDATATALGIALNRTGDLHEFDFAATAKLLEGLKAADFDLLATGFGKEELEKITQEWDVAAGEMQELPDGDRAPFQQMTFTLHDSQVDRVKAAMALAGQKGPFDGSPNENSNGNALARIVEAYLGTS